MIKSCSREHNSVDKDMHYYMQGTDSDLGHPTYSPRKR